MPFTDKFTRLFRQPARANPAPVPLIKAAPFVPAPAPIVPPHPDDALVRAEWIRIETIYPGMSWPEFLRRLEHRYRFFAEERDARTRRLASIQTSLKVLP